METHFLCLITWRKSPIYNSKDINRSINHMSNCRKSIDNHLVRDDK